MKYASAAKGRFGWMYGLYFAGYMSFFSFYGVFLRQCGFSASALGGLSAGTAACNLVSLPICGILADRIGNPRRIMLSCALLSSLWGLLLLPARTSVVAATAVIIPVSCLDYALLSMLDVWTNAAAREDSMVQYSVARACGSLAGAAASLGLGQLLYHIHTDKLIWFHMAFYLALLCVGSRAGSVRLQPSSKRVTHTTGKLSPGYWLFLLATLLLFLGWRALMTYLPTMVVDFGGDSRQQGAIMAGMSFCSMAGLWLYPRLRRHAGTKVFLVIGAVCMVVRLAAMAQFTTLLPLVLAQGLELLSYGLFQPAAMEYITAHVPTSCCATALSLYTALQMPAGTILANAITMPLLQMATLQTAFALFAVLAAMGVLLLLASVRWDGTPDREGSNG